MRIARASILLTLLAVLPLAIGFSQSIPQSDDFNYTPASDLDGQGNWLTTGTPGNSVLVASFGLTYTGYSNSGVGNSALFGTDRRGMGLLFQVIPGEIVSGSVYYSMMIKVDSSSLNGSNIISLSSTEQSEKGALLFLQDGGSGWKFGIKKITTGGAADPVYLSTTFTKTETQVIVVKYTFNTGSGVNDELDLWVNPDLSGSEPSPDVQVVDAGIGDALGFNYLEFLEQSSADSTYYYADGVRVATSWSNAPLPVQIVSVSAVANLLEVRLNWTTATETHNFGFEIQRRAIGVEGGGWSSVGFVHGNGTTSSLREYSFIDPIDAAGRYAYRLKQVDEKGAFTYFSATEIEVGLALKEFTLGANYPNPFNPTTNITFSIPEDGKAQLRVYNMLGQEVAVLFDGVAVGGRIYKTSFNAAALPSGLYFSRLIYEGRVLTRKMTLIR